MRSYPFNRKLSYLVLCVSLVVVFVLFGVRVKYGPGAYYSIAIVQFLVICASAWGLGARAIRDDALEHRRLAVAGALLIMPWALFSFLAGVGPPGDQSAAENELRYLLLLVSTMAVASGLIVLAESLKEAGERFFSTLGFAAILIATPLYLVWASIMLQDFRGVERAASGEASDWIRWMRDLTDVLLFFGGIMTFVASAAFAMALDKVQWLATRSTQGCVVASIAAVSCLIQRGIRFPDPAAIQWYDIPGFVFGIPAIPWIMPCLFGIVLLRRVGNRQD